MSGISGITSALLDGCPRAVCDGSFDIGYVTAGWCVDGNGIIVRGVNIVPIVSDTLDPTTCELAGIYTIFGYVGFFQLLQAIWWSN